MSDTTTIIRLCRERAAQYGAVRRSSLTAIALDRAGDALEDALGINRPSSQAGAASREGQRSTLSNPSTFGRPTFGFEVAALSAAAPAMDKATDPGDMNDYMEAIDAGRPRQPPAGQEAAVERVMILVDAWFNFDQLPTSKCNEFAELVAAAIAPQPQTDRRDSTS